jgi:ankyrin repeat protein
MEKKYSKDIYQKIAENADDKTALRILSSNKDLYNDKYFYIIFNKRYPQLLQYKLSEENDEEGYKEFYLRMLEAIGLLKEKYNFIYEKGNPQFFLQLLENNPTPNSLLHDGVTFNSYRLVKMAIEKGADVNLEGGYALTWAIRRNDLNMIKYLLENGAIIYPKHLTLSYKKDEIKKLLEKNI